MALLMHPVVKIVFKILKLNSTKLEDNKQF